MLSLCNSPRVVALLAAAAVSTCASAFAAEPPQLARCVKLHDLWARYEDVPIFAQSSQKQRVEYAFDRCQHGEFEPNMHELEKIVAQGKVPLPPL
jgi:hypothetical protein